MNAQHLISPASPGHSVRRRGILVAIVILAAVVRFLPDFRAEIIPVHDSLQYLSSLQIYYSGLTTHGEMPLWIPYGRYGNVAFLTTMYLTPFTYTAAAVGALFGVQDVLCLFKAVVFVEYVIFCLGTIGLGLLLFRRFQTLVFLAIGTVLSFTWIVSIDSAFHTYYLLPTILANLVLLFRTGRLRYLALAGLVAVCSSVGNIPYYPPLLALLLTIFCVLHLLWRDRPSPRWTMGWPDAAAFVLFGLGAAVYLSCFLLNFRHLACGSPDRTAAGTVPLDVFLTYAGVTKPVPLAWAFLSGSVTHGDTVFYIGLLPLVLFFVAIWAVPRRDALIFAAMAVFLVLFSFGGYTARMAYHFPGMAYYRHVGLIFGQARFFILMAAAYGFDAMMGRAGRLSSWLTVDAMRRWRRLLDDRRRLVLVAATLCMIVAEFVRASHDGASPWHFSLYPPTRPFSSYEMGWPMFRLVLYPIVLWLCWVFLNERSRNRGGILAIALLAGLALDLGSWTGCVIQNWPGEDPRITEKGRDVFRPHALEYRPTRVSPILLHERDPSLLLLGRHIRVVTTPYVHAYAVAGVDPCAPVYRTDFVEAGVGELLRQGGVLSDKVWCRRTLGCQFPKIRVVPDASFTHVTEGGQPMLLEKSIVSAVAATPKSEKGADPAALAPQSEKDVAPATSAPPNDEEGVVVTSFSWNGITIDVDAPKGERTWLYYADAYRAGWRAWRNGQSVPIVRANWGFKAIELEPGKNTVRMTYFDSLGSTAYVAQVGMSLIMAVWVCAVIAGSVLAPAPRGRRQPPLADKTATG